MGCLSHRFLRNKIIHIIVLLILLVSLIVTFSISQNDIDINLKNLQLDLEQDFWPSWTSTSSKGSGLNRLRPGLNFQESHSKWDILNQLRLIPFRSNLEENQNEIEDIKGFTVELDKSISENVNKILDYTSFTNNNNNNNKRRSVYTFINSDLISTLSNDDKKTNGELIMLWSKKIWSLGFNPIIITGKKKNTNLNINKFKKWESQFLKKINNNKDEKGNQKEIELILENVKILFLWYDELNNKKNENENENSIFLNYNIFPISRDYNLTIFENLRNSKFNKIYKFNDDNNYNEFNFDYKFLISDFKSLENLINLILKTTNINSFKELKDLFLKIENYKINNDKDNENELNLVNIYETFAEFTPKTLSLIYQKEIKFSNIPQYIRTLLNWEFLKYYEKGIDIIEPIETNDGHIFARGTIEIAKRLINGVKKRENDDELNMWCLPINEYLNHIQGIISGKTQEKLDTSESTENNDKDTPILDKPLLKRDESKSEPESKPESELKPESESKSDSEQESKPDINQINNELKDYINTICNGIPKTPIISLYQSIPPTLQLKNVNELIEPANKNNDKSLILSSIPHPMNQITSKIKSSHIDQRQVRFQSIQNPILFNLLKEYIPQIFITGNIRLKHLLNQLKNENLNENLNGNGNENGNKNDFKFLWFNWEDLVNFEKINEILGKLEWELGIEFDLNVNEEEFNNLFGIPNKDFNFKNDILLNDININNYQVITNTPTTTNEKRSNLDRFKPRPLPPSDSLTEELSKMRSNVLNVLENDIYMTESSINEETEILVDAEKWNFADAIFWHYIRKSWQIKGKIDKQ